MKTVPRIWKIRDKRDTWDRSTLAPRPEKWQTVVREKAVHDAIQFLADVESDRDLSNPPSLETPMPWNATIRDRQRARRLRCKDLNICRECSQPTEQNKSGRQLSLCPKHLEGQRLRARIKRDAKRAANERVENP